VIAAEYLFGGCERFGFGQAADGGVLGLIDKQSIEAVVCNKGGAHLVSGNDGRGCGGRIR